MKMHRLFLTVTAALAVFTFQSCQKSDTNALQEAQYCLNKASADEAKACVAGISSNTSAYSNSLKCAAVFISEGFGSASSLASSLDTLKNPSTGCGGCSSTVESAAAFNFRKSGGSVPNSTDLTTASDAFSFCNASNVKFYAQISSLFQLGTITANLANNSTPNSADALAALLTAPSATLGNLVLTTYASVCTDVTNASDATKAYCTELSSTLTKSNSTDAAKIGACFKLILATPGASCPT